MAKIVNKQVSINAKPNRVYKMITTEDLHSEIAESKVKIEKEAGTSISFYNAFKGKMLLVKPNKMLVFTCRSKGWDKSAGDAVCTLTFENGEDAETSVVSFTMVNVPDEAASEVSKIWNENLWKKLKAYLKGL